MSADQQVFPCVVGERPPVDVLWEHEWYRQVLSQSILAVCPLAAGSSIFLLSRSKCLKWVEFSSLFGS